MANAAPITGARSCAPSNPDLPEIAMSVQARLRHIDALLHALDAETENLVNIGRHECSAVDRIRYFTEIGRDIANSATESCETIEVEARRIQREGC